MTLAGILPHLVELRRRVLLYIASVLLAMALIYPFAGYILLALTAPLRALLPAGTAFVFTDLPGAFWINLHATFLAAMALTFPIFLIQVWLFLKPGLKPSEVLFLKRILIIAPGLFVLGAAFVYGALMPTAWAFFLSFEAGPLALSYLPKIDEYVALSVQLMLVFGLSFELPLVLLLLARLGLVRHAALARQRRVVIVLILVVAAILTPPDVLSQLALALPLWLLFEGALYLIGRIEKKRALDHNDSQT